MIAAIFLLQALAPPDIEFQATVRARELTIEKQGDARLTVTTDPPGRNLVDIQAPRANGAKKIANPVVVVDIEARIAEPAPATPPPE